MGVVWYPLGTLLHPSSFCGWLGHLSPSHLPTDPDNAGVEIILLPRESSQRPERHILAWSRIPVWLSTTVSLRDCLGTQGSEVLGTGAVGGRIRSPGWLPWIGHVQRAEPTDMFGDLGL